MDGGPMKREKIGRLLFVHTVADRLNCSKRHVYRLIEDEQLKSIRLGPRGLRVPEEALGEFLAQQQKDKKD
jgi:excisionase family DNA binding protein